MIFRILGPIEVMGRRGAVRVPAGRQQIILGALLLEANHVVGIDHLIDSVWDEHPPATARSQIQICVSSLRHLLTGLDCGVPIVTTYPGYMLRVDDELDSHVFDRKVQESDAALDEGRLEEAVLSLRGALALWRGRALGGGLVSRQLQTGAIRLDERRTTVLEDCIGLELRLGRHHELTAELSGLVDEHPLRERLRGQLMLALYRSGRQADALEMFRTGREILVDQLGVEPGEELRELEGSILAGDRSKGPGPVAGAGTPAGHIVQPRQLPADVADFTGRGELVDRVETLIGHSGMAAIPVVAITGKPGVGKSTLAVHVAHRVVRHFPDGQLYGDLRGTQHQPAEAGDVLRRFLRALGIPGPVIPDEAQERAEMYRSILAERSVLVVLEDAAVEEQVAPLVPGGSRCAVIVTSRPRLTGLPGSQLCEVDVMDREQALELLGKVIGTPRVAAEPVAADALVRIVGGLPLALRVVAARLVARPHWSLASMMSRLGDERRRLDELEHGDMMVRASLALTYDGLGRQACRLVRLLSLVDQETIPGWIAAALLDDDQARGISLMEQLVDTQMLDGAGVDVSGNPRYKFHDLIRVFARDRLEEHESRQDQAAAVERVVGGWLAIAQDAHRRLYGGDFMVLHGTGRRWHTEPADLDKVLADPLRWLEGERANLCSAVAQAAEAGLDESCWDLAATLVTLFEAHSYFDDWLQTHEIALAAARRAGNLRGVAGVMCSLGLLHLSQRRLAQARLMLTPALELFDELADPHGRALVCRSLGVLAYIERRPGQATEQYEQALRGFRQVGDQIGEAQVLGRIAQIDLGLARYDQAIDRLHEALAICREAGCPRLEGQLLYRLGEVMLQQERYEQAEQILTGVLGMVRATGDMLAESSTLHRLGVTYLKMRELTKAEQAIRQALSLREQIIDQFGACQVRLDLACLLAERGDIPAAAGIAEQAIRTFQDRGSLEWENKARVVLDGILIGNDLVAQQKM